MAEECNNPMEVVMAKLIVTELQMLMRAFSVAASESTPRPVQMIDLPLLDRKHDGPASYLSWSRRVRYILKGKDLEGYLTVCDACELGKHTRSSYSSSGSRSSLDFDLVHSDVWEPYLTTAVNEYKYFVSFIDCFSCVTWLYLMKNKSDVFACFKDFHKGIQTQYGAVVKVLRSDNGTEYTNMAFGEYLSSQGIQHQTTCPYTPE
jgi:transposase InsO family protein